jgi:hypothetical protein
MFNNNKCIWVMIPENKSDYARKKSSGITLFQTITQHILILESNMVVIVTQLQFASDGTGCRTSFGCSPPMWQHCSPDREQAAWNAERNSRALGERAWNGTRGSGVLERARTERREFGTR